VAAVAQAPTSHDPAGTRQRVLGQLALPATDQPSGPADATVRRLLARERSSLPNRDPATRAALAQERHHSTWGYSGTPAPAEPPGQPAWLVIALAVLAAVLALAAGVAVLATRSHHAGQTA
jgi:hypothetical protein